PQGASWSPLRFSTANPAAEASCEAGTGWYTVDTGSDGSATFHQPYVESKHLLEGRDTQSEQAGGVGGNTETRIGHIKWFELAGHRFENPSVAFSLAKTGAFANSYLAGNIGDILLRPFTTVFDF